METFTSLEGLVIIDNLIITIQNNKQYLSDIDGLIGDGDHGINMNKGFTLCREELDKVPGDLIHGLNVLSRVLLMKIGGSMGPLYGKFFSAMALSLKGKEIIGADDIGSSLKASMEAIQSISSAKAGDKTLMDTLIPSVESYENARAEGKSFFESLEDLKAAAANGRDSTINMIARLGRSSRLGERSRGVPDAGAVSCCLILVSMANTIQNLIK